MKLVMRSRPSACESTTLIGSPCVNMATRDEGGRARSLLQRGDDAGAKFAGIGAEIADRVFQKAPPSVAAFGAQGFGRAVSIRRAVRFGPTLDRVDRQAEPLGERCGGFARARERAGDDARHAFAREQLRHGAGLAPPVGVERRIVGRAGSFSSDARDARGSVSCRDDHACAIALPASSAKISGVGEAPFSQDLAAVLPRRRRRASQRGWSSLETRGRARMTRAVEFAIGLASDHLRMRGRLVDRQHGREAGVATCGRATHSSRVRVRKIEANRSRMTGHAWRSFWSGRVSLSRPVACSNAA